MRAGKFKITLRPLEGVPDVNPHQWFWISNASKGRKYTRCISYKLHPQSATETGDETYAEENDYPQ